ncbi:hypothetical protein ABGB18_44760 [Nonomuraea sp. B12E4]|uniref:hypothetical protein n=1 Tax=Nonomuraea sp. B12E4 TaxID=3153564 RepID=UPI00325CBB83
MDQDKQGLLAGVRQHQVAWSPLAVPPDGPGDVVQGLTRQIDGGAVGQHPEFLAMRAPHVRPERAEMDSRKMKDRWSFSLSLEAGVEPPCFGCRRASRAARHAGIVLSGSIAPTSPIEWERWPAATR